MDDKQLEACLAEFQALGFRPRAKGQPKRQPSYGESRYLPKIRALWLSAYELGIVRDKSDGAMEAFITRQTGLATSRWLNDGDDAGKVIEALKGWMARDGGVPFDMQRTRPDGQRARVDPREAIVWAIFLKAVKQGAFKPFAGQLTESCICQFARRHTGKGAFGDFEGKDWTKLIQMGGWLLRKAAGGKALAQQATES
jgi:hypothetical protein